MSLAVGENPSPKTMGFDKEGSATDSEASETKTPSKIPPNEDAVDGHHPPGINRKASESSLCPTEDEDDDDEEEREIELGPKCTLKEQLEKDKDDESLRRWKEQLLGTVDFESVGVDSTKEMIGTFSPQAEPYTHEICEETTPSGMFARGSYSARSKFVDDDNKCYLEINYTFDIRKEWQS
ncbi:hypothetical protein Gogos_008253 [Gossypium gossypioides]|uniref:Rho GDP-dissociation inhibitor 1-like n=1 Tax=Gossypium gossypioides TaxID=34282 RepID=A0A7J9CAZ4_GOSGO|nr:hypothetical protein [Gossypium gossypioides]